MNLFEWDGLPDWIEERHIERILFDHGKAIFFSDPNMSFMCLEAQDGGCFNVNNDPTYYIAVGNGYHKRYNVDDCVIIENNKMRIATRDIVLFYTNKIVEAERTMDINVKSVKTPYIIACDDKDVLTFKRIFEMIDGNTPAIYADKGLNLDALQVMQTKVEFLCNDIMDYKSAVENELMTFLGINNVPVDKKERLVADEASSNDQLIGEFASVQLEAREKACEKINEKYGLSLSVKFRNGG